MRDNLEESTTSDMVTAALYAAQKKEGFQAGQNFASSKAGMHKQRVYLNNRMSGQVVTPVLDPYQDQN